MRKKSHISLAMFIVDSLKEQDLTKHKKAFYLGSILPDCKPSFLTTKHEIGGTFLSVKEEIKRLTEGEVQNKRVFCRDLGQVVHYVADYFTFPHNNHYPGTLKDHCVYEERLKKSLREYIKSEEAALNREKARKLDSWEAICDFIQRAHNIYMKLKTNVEEDCRVIVALCHQVVEAVVRLFQLQGAKIVSATA